MTRHRVSRKITSVIATLVVMVLLVPSTKVPAWSSPIRSAQPASECKLNFNWNDSTTLSFPRIEHRLATSGSQRHLIIAVDFPDARYTGDVRQILAKAFEPKRVSDFYLQNSNGAVNIDFDIHPNVVSLSQSSHNFGGNKFSSVLIGGIWSNDLIHRAAIQELDGKIDLSKYSALHTVVTGGASLSLAGGLASPWSKGFFSFSNGSFSNATLYGSHVLTSGVQPGSSTSWPLLAHEIGHLFGLVDLYSLAGDTKSGKTTGPFDLMAHHADPSKSLLAWPRWQLGWLDDSEVICFSALDLDEKLVIDQLNAKDGIKAVVVRISNSQAFVIETRRPGLFDSENDFVEYGLLAYLVDLGISSGQGVVRVLPDYETSLNQAIYKNIVDSFQFLDAPLVEGEFLMFQDILIENVKSDAKSDTVQILSGQKALARYQDLTKTVDSGQKSESTVSDATRAAAFKNGTFFKLDACMPSVPAKGSLQILVNGEWQTAAQILGWDQSLSCTREDLRQPWTIAKVPPSTQYRWKIASGLVGGVIYSTNPAFITPALNQQSTIKTTCVKGGNRWESVLADAKCPTGFKKLVTITCKKGSSVKKVQGTAPKCPAGFRKA